MAATAIQCEATAINPGVLHTQNSSSQTGITETPYQRIRRKKRDAQLADISISKNRHNSTNLPNYPGLDRWRLYAKIGDGAFSSVYRASDSTPEFDEVAIKVMRKYEMNEQQKANTLKEVEIMRNISHTHAVRLIESFETRQYRYIVMELCPGGELYHRVVDLTHLSEDLTRHVMIQVASAVAYLHETLGVVHRDIKPENILFFPIPFAGSREPKESKPVQAGDEHKPREGEFVPGIGSGGVGTVKLADFGLAKVIAGQQAKTPCGTIGYAAPEINGNRDYSTGVDMWALGCVLYTLLAGFPPFYDEDFRVMTRKVIRGEFSFVSPWWDHVSTSAKDLISGLLTVHPEKRLNIKQFLAHPWIRQTADKAAHPGDAPSTGTDPMSSVQVPAAEKATPASVPPTAFESQGQFPSPGTVNIREIFGVGLSVHLAEHARQAERWENSDSKSHSRGAAPTSTSNVSTEIPGHSMQPVATPDSHPRDEQALLSGQTVCNRVERTSNVPSRLNINHSLLLEKRRLRSIEI